MFLNFGENDTEMFFIVLSKNEQRAIADRGETIEQLSHSYQQMLWHHFQNFRKRKDFMRHRKSKFFVIKKHSTNLLGLDSLGHHSFQGNREQEADHVPSPPGVPEWPLWLRAQSWKGPAETHTAAQSLGLGPTCLHRHNAKDVLLLNRDIPVRTAEDVGRLRCFSAHCSMSAS